MVVLLLCLLHQTLDFFPLLDGHHFTMRRRSLPKWFAKWQADWRWLSQEEEGGGVAAVLAPEVGFSEAAAAEVVLAVAAIYWFWILEWTMSGAWQITAPECSGKARRYVDKRHRSKFRKGEFPRGDGTSMCTCFCMSLARQSQFLRQEHLFYVANPVSIPARKQISKR
jgi:hypothetical protein